MRKEPSNSLSIKALTVWRITAAMNMAIFFAIIVAFIIVSFIFTLPFWISVVLLFLWLVLAIFFIGFYPRIQWRRWKYDVFESEVEIQHGVFFVKRTLVPMVRVQHVDTVHGPLLRRFKLASVTISTAATIHEIPALEEEEADLLRDQISKLARVVEHDE
ncbi:PH domain-containing protein [Bacillus salitolerans]|uniref:PH domain-containing protein n=1 Tax=Bacillus salitolerans TaxID=1437434 RepID=A0ABW4LRI2_9BACI